MLTAENPERVHGDRGAKGAPGSVLVVTLMAVTVLAVLGFTILTFSYSEESNSRREKSSLLAFYAAEGSIHESLTRMNFNPTGPSNDESEIKWNSGSGNPDSVRDPRMVQGNPPDPNPANFSDSAINSWRFWNFDPNWRYSGTSGGGEGNYPGATSMQQANLDLAGRAFTYAGASARSLPSGSNYTVRVVPHVRHTGGGWKFVDELGVPPLNPNYYYYKLTATGTFGGQSATAQVIAKKYFFGTSIPGAITAGGDVIVGGNASVTAGDPGDENPTGVSVQSAGIASAQGSGTITGTGLDHTPFPGFQAVFGITPAEMQALAAPPTGITATYTANETNPSDVPSGTIGKAIWLTAKNAGVKQELTFTGGGPDGYIIGSASEPVLMVVDGDLTLNSVTIYGVIYVTGTFRNQGGSQIKGAILVEGTAETDILGTGTGPETKIAYSKSVLENLNRNSNMFPFRSLKGTWKMSRG